MFHNRVNHKIVSFFKIAAKVQNYFHMRKLFLKNFFLIKNKELHRSDRVVLLAQQTAVMIAGVSVISCKLRVES